MKITLTNYKSFKGMEGYGFNAILNVDGKKVADVIDDASGGQVNYYPLGDVQSAERKANTELLNKAKEYAKTLPSPHKYHDDTVMPMDLDLLMDDLVNELQRKKDEKKGIMLKTEYGYSIIQWNATLPTMLKKYKGAKEAIQKEIDKQDKDLILNKEYLKSLEFKVD